MTIDMVKKRIQVYLEEEVYELLEKISKKEIRSLPNVGEALIVEALRGRGMVEDPEIKEDEK